MNALQALLHVLLEDTNFRDIARAWSTGKLVPAHSDSVSGVLLDDG